MKQFPPGELIRFLCKTDEFLTKTCELIIIGGAAASLAYGAGRTTTDIDSASELSDALEVALEKARGETGSSISVSYVGIFDPPYNYLNRVKALKDPPLVKL